MKKFLIISLIMLVHVTHATANSDQLINKMHHLMDMVNTLNTDIQIKNQQKHKLDQAIQDSKLAISQSQQVLHEVQKKRNLDLQQLHNIQNLSMSIESIAQETKHNIQHTTNIIYAQILLMQTQSDSILAVDTINTRRKQLYLIKLLRAEITQYNILQAQLTKFIELNHTLLAEVQTLNDKLQLVNQQHRKLVLNTQHKEYIGHILVQQIQTTKQKLQNLKYKQAQLNQLINNITQQNVNQNNPQVGQHESPINDNVQPLVVSDDAFFKLSLVKPINAVVTVAFGELRNNTRNNGILYTANNTSVFAIYKGLVRYVGVLPGFGDVVVLDHGNGYLSIYAGVIPSVKIGTQVSTGQVIANAGSDNNQPLGGVYFELRHLGQPINPNRLIN